MPLASACSTELDVVLRGRRNHDDEVAASFAPVPCGIAASTSLLDCVSDSSACGDDDCGAFADAREEGTTETETDRGLRGLELVLLLLVVLVVS